MRYEIRINNSEIDLIRKRIISDEDADIILHKMTKFRTAMLIKDYKAMIMDNLGELSKTFCDINLKDERLYISFFRHLYNFVGAVYAWVEYCEINYKEGFSSIKSKYYDDCFEYRFLYNLRKYMTHFGIDIIKIRYLGDDIGYCIYIDLLKMIENDRGMNKTFVNEIKSRLLKGEELDLHELIEGFERVFLKMYREIIEYISVEADNDIDSISELLQDVDLSINECLMYERNEGRYVENLSGCIRMLKHKLSDQWWI